MKSSTTAYVAIILSLSFALTAQEKLVPVTSVAFASSDTTLKKLYDRAEKLALENIVEYGDRKVLIEGGKYRSIWLETQPMGGYMYACRNIDIARNNIGIFMDYQRDDGRLPGVIYNREGRIDPNYCQFQGFYFPMPAFELYFLTGRDSSYLRKVYKTLEKFDGYLWKTRDSDHNGCLESWCIYDTGEDGNVRFNGFPNAWSFDYPPTKEAAAKLTKEELQMQCKQSSYDSTISMTVPIESMDIMSYSYSCRDVLALVSKELSNGKEEYWRNRADEVKDKIKTFLWDEDKAACFDKDKDNKTMPILLHNNLRCMYFGSFDQGMADKFIKYHLVNPEEFWTPMPLPSIAANDPLFQNISGNNWSGQPQGLTFQRSVQALENYGHYAELTEIGQKFLRVLGDSLKFTQQFDPFTAKINNSKDGYGPSILAALEFISRFYGVHITQDKIYWSCLENQFDYNYSQKWNGRDFTLETEGDKAYCSVDGRFIFSFTRGARIVTDLNGDLIEIIGITKESKMIRIKYNKEYSLLVKPNSIYGLNQKGRIAKIKEVGFFGQ